MFSVHARFTDTHGNGVGRWRLYYSGAEDMREAKWAARDLVPNAQIRVMEGRKVVVSPRRASEWLTDVL